MNAAIEVEGLSKTFRVTERAPGFAGALRALLRPVSSDVPAVSDISFRIEPGERVAFIGQNGAGKSTTLKMLSGILHPTTGLARVCGHVPWRERKQLAYRIGTVFGQRSQLFYHLPPADTFALLGKVYDQHPQAHARRCATIVETFDIGPFLHKPVAKLSLGQRMRCEIVASLLHAPDILFLDEPTIGLDVAAKAAIRDLLRHQSDEEGRTIMLTSHDTGDMERVCDRVIVIHGGRVLLDQSLAQLRRNYIDKKLVVVQSVEPSVAIALPGVRMLSSAPHRTELAIDIASVSLQTVLAQLMRQVHVLDLTIHDPPMEEIIAAIYRDAAGRPELPTTQAAPP